MRNKTGILILSIVIALLSVYQLSFTLVGNKQKQRITEFAEKGVKEAKAENPNIDEKLVYKLKEKQMKDSLWKEDVFLGYTYGEVKKLELSLGLDLQGGMHATLIISPEEIVKAMANGSKDPKFLEAIEEAKQQAKSTQTRFSTLFYDAYTAKVGKGKLWEIFLNSAKNINANSTDEEILTLIDTQLDQVLDNTLIVLRSRIDKFGATQPIIHPIKATGRIEVELPGVDDEERVKKQLTSVAKLEFLEVWSGQEVQPYWLRINDYLKLENARNKATEPTTEPAVETASTDSSATTNEETPAEDEEDPLFAAETETDTTVVATTDSSTTEEDDDALFADVDTAAAGAKDSLALAKEQQEQFKENFPIYDYIIPDQRGFGYYASVENYAKVQELFSRDAVKAILPANMTLMWSAEAFKSGNKVVPLYFVKKGENVPAPLSGEVIENARQDINERGEVVVDMQMDNDGAHIWARLTEANAGKQIAIALDDAVFSAPRVNEPITGGRSSISGSFEIQEAQDLANVLEAGSLPAPIEIERLVVVGPSLGKESIQKGLISLLAGLGLVIIFMIVYYRKGGSVSDIALLFNILFILGLLATPGIGAALTLPGIAGIVLTIGMSIDANVLIFERIREEMKAGKSANEAVNEGYKKAFWTIFDANITTLITAIILFVFGTGLIKGFAITLIIGVCSSFFSAVFITRLIIELMAGKAKDMTKITFESNLAKKLFQNVNYEIIGKRKVAYIVSLVIIALGITSVAIEGGLNLGVAFKGGHSYIVKFDSNVAPEKARAELQKTMPNSSIEVKTFDGNDQLQITTSYLIDSDDEGADDKVKAALLAGLANTQNPQILQTNSVGPTIANDIKQAALTSIILALIAIFAYVFIRFRKWQFGLGALAALFHDVAVVISVFAIARVAGISFEIDEVFIAAVLTIVGYSINDTVVVFDRVREFLNNNREADLGETLNNSINSTFSRTFMTSFTTLLVIIVLLVFGGDALRGFSFALFIGVAVGTYSSIFIATPTVLDTSGGKSLAEEESTFEKDPELVKLEEEEKKKAEFEAKKNS
ncbi:MAG: protein translocase subunit SecDF [Cytophagales bacterium]|nr:protein translocase subunit SecDF [Cytophagales bacterium]